MSTYRPNNIIIFEDKSEYSNINTIKPTIDTGLVLYSPIDLEIAFREDKVIYLGLLLTIPKNMYCIVDSKYTLIDHNIKLPDQDMNYIKLYNNTSVNGLSIKKGDPIAEVFLIETITPRLIIRNNKENSKYPHGPDGKPIYNPYEVNDEPQTTIELSYK